MSAQKLLRAALAIDRNRECELRSADFSGFTIRSAVQDSLKFRDEIQVVVDLVAFIFPGGRGNRLRQQSSPPAPLLPTPPPPPPHTCHSPPLATTLKPH